MKEWKVLQLNKDRAMEIANYFELPIIVAMLLDIRGITEEEDILSFISSENELSDPFLMADMDKAVVRIQKALYEGEKICIYGDYDADGVTSTALLYSYLETAGADVMFYIPSRENEGYGLNKAAIDTIKQYNITLMITVDNGVSAYEEIEYANRLGIDTVITDHHKTPEVLPNAAAVVNPHRPDCDSPFKELAGVGVVFKLIMAMEDHDLNIDALLERYADIAALGTIGDVVSLTGENRVFVKNGLQYIEGRKNLGVEKLMEDAGICGNKLTAGRLSFTLVPRINAGGRLGLSEKSVKLLLTKDSEEAASIASELGQDNKQRQSIEKEILVCIKDYLSDHPEITAQPIIVISGENWHAGVIGIVASRIKEIYGKPVVIISYAEEQAKASARSIKGFSIIDAIASCKELLSHFGGHPMAAGFSLPRENIVNFTKQINDYARELGDMPLPLLEIDCKLNPANLSLDLAKQILDLEPFGSGNPTPLFGLYTMTLKDIKPIGGGNHLRLTFSREETSITAMFFSTKPTEFPYQIGETLDLAVTIDVNEYNGKETLSIVIRDVKLSTAKMGKMIESNRVFERLILQQEPLTAEQTESLLPKREDFATVFRFLKLTGGWQYSADVLCSKIADEQINYGKLMVILTAMHELAIIEKKEHAGILYVKLLPVAGKMNIQHAPIVKALQ